MSTTGHDVAAHRQTAQTSTQDIARYLEENLGRTLVGELAGVAPKTVGRWVDGEHPRREAEDRLRIAFHVFHLLRDAGESDHVVRAWFIGLNPQLDDRSPIEGLAEGRTREVLTAARSFALGG